MPNPICEKCKADHCPANTEQIVQDTGCSVTYDIMDKCMKVNSGNIASCRNEWDKFRECMKETKNFNKK